MSLDRTTGIISFIHHSADQFIRSCLTRQDPLISDLDVSESAIAEALLTYLSFGEFQSPVHSPNTSKSDLNSKESTVLGYAREKFGQVYNWLRGEPRFETHKIIKDSFYAADFDLMAVVSKMEGLSYGSSLYSYARDFWAIHCKAYQELPSNRLTYQRLVSLVFYKQLRFSFRPWAGVQVSDKKFGDSHLLGLFTWLLAHGHTTFLHLMAEFENGIALKDFLTSTQNDYWMFTEAYKNGDRQFVELFTDLYVACTKRTPKLNGSSIIYAASQNRSDMVAFSLERVVFQIESSSEGALDHAAIGLAFKNVRFRAFFMLRNYALTSRSRW